jgi:hypothetical protein
MYINHPVLGELTLIEPHSMGDLLDLKPQSLGGTTVPARLFYSAKSLRNIAPTALEPLANLAQQLTDFDAVVRAQLGATLIEDWLDHHNDITMWQDELQAPAARELARIFPGVSDLTRVTHAQFAATLWLERICFSLDSSLSGGATLTMDYRVLPVELDDNIIAAKFDEAGAFMGAVIES